MVIVQSIQPVRCRADGVMSIGVAVARLGTAPLNEDASRDRYLAASSEGPVPAVPTSCMRQYGDPPRIRDIANS